MCGFDKDSCGGKGSCGGSGGCGGKGSCGGGGCGSDGSGNCGGNSGCGGSGGCGGCKKMSPKDVICGFIGVFVPMAKSVLELSDRGMMPLRSDNTSYVRHIMAVSNYLLEKNALKKDESSDLYKVVVMTFSGLHSAILTMTRMPGAMGISMDSKLISVFVAGIVELYLMECDKGDMGEGDGSIYLPQEEGAKKEKLVDVSVLRQFIESDLVVRGAKDIVATPNDRFEKLFSIDFPEGRSPFDGSSLTN